MNFKTSFKALFLVLFLGLSFASCEEDQEQIPVFTVSFDTSGGTSIEDQEVVQGKLATRPTDPTKEGFTFVNWYVGEQIFDFKTTIIEDTKLTARWEEIVFTVSFNTDGGSEIESQKIPQGEYALRPNEAPTKEGFAFIDWYKDELVFNFETAIMADLELLAKWEKVYQPITNPDATAYITEIIEFLPAPGQFLNEVENDFEAAKNIVGNTNQFISLGTFGGSVSFKFDHSILNGEGEDIAIYGNPFKGSSEPAIVMVCQDMNQNGKPDADEPWYELKGSEYDKEETKHNVKVTYYRPAEDADQHLISYAMEWNGETTEGVLDFTAIKPFHSQPMFPTCYEEDQVTVEGAMLASNMVNNNGFYTLPKYDWGYAENAGYENEGILRSADLFDIDNAVDANGEPVVLTGIDFVKVYTATMDMAGWLGERSPEIFKAADISLLENE